MIPSLSIGPRTLLNDCNHSATAIFWRSAIRLSVNTAERLGFPRMLEGLLTGIYPDTDPPTNKKSEASIFCGKKMMEDGRVS